MIPTDELKELLADCKDARRDGETVLASTLRVQFAHSRLGYRAPSLAAEVLSLRETIVGLEAENAALLHDLKRQMTIANVECNEAARLREMVEWKPIERAKRKLLKGE